MYKNLIKFFFGQASFFFLSTRHSVNRMSTIKKSNTLTSTILTCCVLQKNQNYAWQTKVDLLEGQKVWSKWTTSVQWYFICQNSDVLYHEIDTNTVAGSSSQNRINSGVCTGVHLFFYMHGIVLGSTVLVGTNNSKIYLNGII